MPAILPLEIVNTIVMMRGRHPLANIIEEAVWDCTFTYEMSLEGYRLKYYEDDPENYEDPEQTPFHVAMLKKV